MFFSKSMDKQTHTSIQWTMLSNANEQTTDNNMDKSQGQYADGKKLVSKGHIGTSLVAQWLRIHLGMQGTWVRSLVWQDPTCCGATKTVSHNYWASALEPASHSYWGHAPQLLKPALPKAHMPQLLSLRAATTEALVPRAHAPQQEKPLQWEAHAPQRRVAPAHCN